MDYVQNPSSEDRQVPALKVPKTSRQFDLMESVSCVLVDSASLVHQTLPKVQVNCDTLTYRTSVDVIDFCVEEADEERSPLERWREVTFCRTQFQCTLLFATIERSIGHSVGAVSRVLTETHGTCPDVRARNAATPLSFSGSLQTSPRPRFPEGQFPDVGPQPIADCTRQVLTTTGLVMPIMLMVVGTKLPLTAACRLYKTSGSPRRNSSSRPYRWLWHRKWHVPLLAVWRNGVSHKDGGMKVGASSFIEKLKKKICFLKRGDGVVIVRTASQYEMVSRVFTILEHKEVTVIIGTRLGTTS